MGSSKDAVKSKEDNDKKRKLDDEKKSDKEKKQKNEKQNGSVSKKSTPNTSVTFKVIDPKSCPGYIAHFKRVPPSVDLLESVAPKSSNKHDNDALVFNAFCDPKHVSEKQILIAETSKVNFKGENFGPSAKKNAVNYMIGIYNKKKGEVELISTPGVMEMKAEITGLSFELEESTDKADALAKLPELVNRRTRGAFNRNKESKENSTLSVDFEANEEMNERYQALKAKETEVVIPYELLPPIKDASATNEDSLFDMQKIIDEVGEANFPVEGIFDSDVKKRVKLILKETGLPQECVQEVLRPKVFTAKADRSRLKVAMALYFGCLLAFKDGTPYAKSNPMTKHPEIYKNLSSLFLRKYAGRLTQDSAQVAKMMTYLIIIAMYLNDWSMPLTELSKLLKITENDMKKYARGLGMNAGNFLSFKFPWVPSLTKARKVNK